MKGLTTVMALTMAFGFAGSVLAAQTPAAADFFVATDGDNRWSGTLASPNAQGTDGPFATLARARDAVRDRINDEAGNTRVLIRQGIYRLNETVVFGVADSGRDNATITYGAYPGEKPVFSSGRPITGWQKADPSLVGLPRAAAGKVWVADVSGRFLTLFDQQGRLPRARSAAFIQPAKGSRDLVHFPEGMLKSWPNVEDVEIVVRPHHA